MQPPALDSTYSAWLISLVVEISLFGMRVLQTWIYFAGRPADRFSIKLTVFIVLALESIQVAFFLWSSYFRFIRHFGEIQTNWIWADSLQLLAAYLSAFVVQIFFANRIHRLTENRARFSLSALGIYVILGLAIIHILAGIAQTIISYELRSFLKPDETKPITTLQIAASLACDLLITAYLCIFLKSQKGEMMRTNSMMDTLIYDTINRGILIAMSSLVTMVLFLVLPDTLWFFLGFAPRIYMNNILTTLNTRQRIRDEMTSWNSIHLTPWRRTTPTPPRETTLWEQCGLTASFMKYPHGPTAPPPMNPMHHTIMIAT
ncbi:hypothetical protein B0H17DRAFT_1190605 [Mycena rosella]|uniref:DUF6534 domain-containing protein n=1 Tax=Mycena rosella TaxID=1033263 RepID=A0AAD7H2X5_MYCRO|nr:hypothetical protein B0H17DRAFT_1190605 [Mycena rosella]